MRYILMMLLCFSVGYSGDGIVIDAKAKMYTHFIGNVTLERQVGGYVWSVADDFDTQEKFYSAFNDENTEDITNILIDAIRIKAPNIDLSTFPSRVKVDYGYAKSMDDTIIWIANDILNANDLKNNNTSMHIGSNCSAFASKLETDIRLPDDVKDLTDTSSVAKAQYDAMLKNIYFVCRIAPDSDIDLSVEYPEYIDAIVTIKLKVETTVILIGEEE